MPSLLSQVVRKLKYGDPVVVVSGLPRSGTSMAMKMLEAGGLELVVDHVREADEDNPKGYFEDERVKDLAEQSDRQWIADARGKAVKVVSSLLNYLPDDNLYRVVFMRRDLREVLASQAKMLVRRGEEHDASDEDMLEMYRSHLDKVEFQLRFRSNFDPLFVDYAAVLEDPRREAERMAEFVGGQLDVDRMVEVVDARLYRNRRVALPETSD
jgi:hypothetical protein